jgi:hypothetical protein
MTKTKTKPDYKPYPERDGYRSGIKVSWLHYRSKVNAETASEAAKHNARIMEGMGYDFGYQSPGSITRLENGKWEVCIP